MLFKTFLLSKKLYYYAIMTVSLPLSLSHTLSKEHSIMNKTDPEFKFEDGNFCIRLLALENF